MSKMITLTNAWTGQPIAFNPSHIVAIHPIEEKDDNEKEAFPKLYGPKMKIETYIVTSGQQDGEGGYPVAEKFDVVYERVTAS